jgi:hypothetical protein
MDAESAKLRESSSVPSHQLTGLGGRGYKRDVASSWRVAVIGRTRRPHATSNID